MIRHPRLPLAWLNLAHRPRRLAASAAGVAFAVVLIHMEVGFLNALYDAQVELLVRLDADIIVCNRVKHAMVTSSPFPRRRLAQAAAVPGVASAYPLYVELEIPQWKDRVGRISRPIRLIAFDPDHPALLLPEVTALAGRLREPWTALIDANSREVYGNPEAGASVELSGHAVRVVGTFHLGADYLSDGNAIVSDRTFLALFPDAVRPPGAGLGRVELGLIRVEPGADPSVVAWALRKTLPGDVAVWTKRDFIARERKYWRDNTPLGYIFGLGAALGFLVGMIICYQILFTDITDNLPSYATLMAIGYRGGFLVKLVLEESLYLALIGFVPGVLISAALFNLVARMTHLPMRLTLARGGMVLSLTLAMCLASGVLALRKVLAADPAEVFR